MKYTLQASAKCLRKLRLTHYLYYFNFKHLEPKVALSFFENIFNIFWFKKIE